MSRIRELLTSLLYKKLTMDSMSEHHIPKY